MTSKIVDIASRGEAVSPAEAAVGQETDDRAHLRTPWNGSLAESELGMPGGLLLAALTSCANSRGHHFTKMAEELGVTYGYIAQLRNGNREVSQVSDDFALACARYLVVPRVTVLMLSGRLSPSDLFESDEMMASEITRAFEFVCSDPEWGPLVTAELRQAGMESQFAMIRLYEKATGKTLMSHALDVKSLAVEVAKLADIQASRKAAVADATTARKRGPRKA